MNRRGRYRSLVVISVPSLSRSTVENLKRSSLLFEEPGRSVALDEALLPIDPVDLLDVFGVAVSVEGDTLYDFVVDWGEFGSIEVDVRDPVGNALGSVSATDETFTDGGIGVRSTGVLDNVRFR